MLKRLNLIELDTFGLKVGDEGIITKGEYGYYNIDIFCPKYETIKNICVETKWLELVKGSSREKIEAKIATLRQEITDKYVLIDELQSKINYMDETGNDMFDENEFKAYQTLTIIEKGNLSKLDKARAIAALLNQK
jgi:hypothetical protein